MHSTWPTGTTDRLQAVGSLIARADDDEDEDEEEDDREDEGEDEENEDEDDGYSE